MVDDGRLEVCQVGVWGTICNYLWDRNDATVACRQLGLNVTGTVQLVNCTKIIFQLLHIIMPNMQLLIQLSLEMGRVQFICLGFRVTGARKVSRSVQFLNLA